MFKLKNIPLLKIKYNNREALIWWLGVSRVECM